MRITSNLFQTSSLFLKGSYSNIKRVNVQNTDSSARRDRNSVSPQGRTMSMIQQLTDQKKNISQRKHDLIGRTLEVGGNMEHIETQLDALDEQISQVDQQISQLTASLAEQLAQKLEKKDKDGREPSDQDDGKTAEQLQTEQLTHLAAATDKLGQAEAVAALGGKVESMAAVKEGEIGMSDVQADTYESMEKIAQGMAVADGSATLDETGAVSRTNLTGMEKVIARIRADMVDTGIEVSQLRQLAQNLELDQMEQLREAGEQADAAEKTPAAEAAPDEKTPAQEAGARAEDEAEPPTDEAPQKP